MARKSKGRGTAAAFGLLLLVAGLVGGGVLYMLSVRRPSDVVDDFARAPVGCTTTLRFTETGTFFVFEDVSAVIEVPEGGCEPSADPTQTFAFELTGPDGPVVPRAADELSYDTDDHVGNSVARVEISMAGEYEIVVVGDDAGVVAAIGRDPDDGVDELRRRAMIVAIVGVVLGGLLLLLAGRQSKHAATFITPEGPGWGPEQAPRARVLPLDDAHASRQPVNPHEPDQQVAIAPPLSEVNNLLAQPPLPKRRPAWAPPDAGDQAPEQPEAVPVVSPSDQSPDRPAADMADEPTVAVEVVGDNIVTPGDADETDVTEETEETEETAVAEETEVVDTAGGRDETDQGEPGEAADGIDDGIDADTADDPERSPD